MLVALTKLAVLLSILLILSLFIKFERAFCLLVIHFFVLMFPQFALFSVFYVRLFDSKQTHLVKNRVCLKHKKFNYTMY